MQDIHRSNQATFGEFLFCFEISEIATYRVSPDVHTRKYTLQSSNNIIRKSTRYTLSQSTYCTYIEYRAVSGVFRTIDPPPRLQPASVSSPCTKGAVLHYTLAGR
jgi:hypothetical protein